MRDLKLYLALLPIFVVVDLLWIGLVMRGFYDEQLGSIARRSAGSLSPRWVPALMTYALIPAGIILFVQARASDETLMSMLFWGAVYGVIVYGVYDLTNRATLENFSLTMTLADMAWGTFLCAAMSGMVFGLKKFI